MDRAPWVSSEKIIIYTKCLDNRGSCPISIKWENIIFTKWKVGAGFCGPCPMSIKWKNIIYTKCLDNRGSCPISIKWENIIFTKWKVGAGFCGPCPMSIKWKNNNLHKVLGQSWILPHEYHMIFYCLDNRGSCPMSIKWENIIFTKWKVGVGFCGPCPMSIKWKKYNLHKVLGQSWTVPHEYQVKK